MAIKMNELVKLTDTAKSTILFYVKEGLLPEPQKPKANLHLYDEECVETIRFIKYLQTHFGSSINEIKGIIKNGKFDFKRGFEALLETLDVVMGSAHQSTYTAEYILNNYDLTAEELQFYLDEEVLFKRDGVFTDRELEILEIILNLQIQGIDKEIWMTYVKHARALSEFEVAFSKNYLDSKERSNDAVKALFDATLILKPYIFNMHTFQAYKTAEEK